MLPTATLCVLQLHDRLCLSLAGLWLGSACCSKLNNRSCSAKSWKALRLCSHPQGRAHLSSCLYALWGHGFSFCWHSPGNCGALESCSSKTFWLSVHQQKWVCYHQMLTVFNKRSRFFQCYFKKSATENVLSCKFNSAAHRSSSPQHLTELYLHTWQQNAIPSSAADLYKI